MEYEVINSLACCIDNVYGNTAEVASRKTIAKLVDNNCMAITYMTILNIARENDLHIQMRSLKKESSDMISYRLKTIKSNFKEQTKRALKAKKFSEKDNIETLTVSPYSPKKTLKFSHTVVYEVS